MTRLIDADALKDAINKIVAEEIEIDKKWASGLKYSLKIIDNAPTVDVEITEKQAILFLINNGWLVNHDKELREKWERPQGEYKTACNVLLSLEQIVRKSDGWEDSAVEAVRNAVQTAIKCMHERPQGEWIPVSERLPDKNGECLVSLDFGDVNIDAFVDGIFVCYLGNVIAWQPLPEPYKEGMRGKEE